MKHTFEFKTADANKAKAKRFSDSNHLNWWVKGDKNRFYFTVSTLGNLGAKETSGTFGYVSEAYFDFSGDKKEVVVISNKEDYEGNMALDLAKALTEYCNSKGIK